MHLYKYVLLLFCCGYTLSSCVKDPAYAKRSDDKENVVIYLKQATSPNLELQLFPFIDNARTITLNAGFGGIGYPDSDVKITLSEDLAALDSVNQIRSAGGLPEYELFPEDAYEFPDKELIIEGGTLTSNLATFNYYPKKFDPTKDYLLPLTITDASGYAINPKGKTVLLVANKLAGRPADTEGWEGTASSEQTEWENTGLVAALFDGDINTYWHSSWWPEEPLYPHWVQVDMKQLNYVDKIGLVARQNNTNGFAKFNLDGSEDGTNWTNLLTDAVFDPSDKAQQTYELLPAQWRFFRLTMTEGRLPSHRSTHLAEFIIYKY